MRVLAVVNGLGTGGAERSLAESVEPLRARGIEVEFAVLYQRTNGVEPLVAQQTAVHHLPPRSDRRVRALRKLTRQGGFGLVHTTLFEADLAGRLSSIGGPPVLTSLVNTSYDPARLSDPLIRRHRLEVARLADAASGRIGTKHYHAISHAVADSAHTRLRIPQGRITVIPRGRDRERLGANDAERRTRTRNALGVGDHTHLLVAVGRQEHQKGHVHLIRALPQILATHPDTHLLIAGREGNASPETRQAIASLALDRHVTMLGHVDNVPDLLAASDALVFPSLYEGLGGTLLEAMALSTPIVTSDLPVTREVAGEAALYATPADPASLASNTTALLSDEQLRTRLGAEGEQRFSENFELGRVTDQMAALMHRVARDA